MNSKISSQIDKKDNGNIEIVFAVPSEILKAEYQKVLEESAKEAVIPGFRKGKAPLNKVAETVSDERATDHILNHILPKAFADSVKEHKFNPGMYPKFEVIKITSTRNITDGTEWQIKAVTCEIPKVVLGNYKTKIKGKTVDEIAKEITQIINLEIPDILIQEEVGERLSQLLARIEKLGLSLEGYLKSVGKSVEQLRSEYQDEAKRAISLELILNEVANEEKIDVGEDKVDEFIKTTGYDPKAVGDEQRKMLKRIVIRREALEKLASKV